MCVCCEYLLGWFCVGWGDVVMRLLCYVFVALLWCAVVFVLLVAGLGVFVVFFFDGCASFVVWLCDCCGTVGLVVG